MKKMIFGFILLIALIGVFILFRTSPKPQSAHLESVAQGKVPAENTHASLGSTQLPPSAEAQSPTVQDTEIAQDSSGLVLSKDEEGRETNVQTFSSRYYQDLFASKRPLSPDEELESLEAIEFSDEQNKMLSGVFLDSSAGIGFSLSWDTSSAELSSESCLRLEDKTILDAQSGGFDMRSSGNGYAVVKIFDHTFIRFGVVFDRGRHLVGQIFKRTQNGDWNFSRDLEAQEIQRSEATAGACYFKEKKI